MPRVRHAYLEQNDRRGETRYYRTLILAEPGGAFTACAEWGKFRRRPSRRRTVYRGADRSAAIAAIDEVINAKRREGWNDTRDPQRDEAQPSHPRLTCLLQRAIRLPRRGRARLRVFAPIGDAGLGAIVLESAVKEAFDPYHETHKRLLRAVAAELWPEEPAQAPYVIYLRGPRRGADETFYQVTVSWPTQASSLWLSSFLSRASRPTLEVATGPLGPAPRRPVRRSAA